MCTKYTKRTAHGFSLIELMIVVVVISILAAIAIPSYLKSIQKSRRSDAVALLSQDQGILERCYASTFDYSSVTLATPPAGCAALVTTSPNGYYTLVMPANIPVSPAATYQITAEATGPQASDTGCTYLSIDNTNNPTAMNSAKGAVTPASTCWPQ